MRLLVAGGVCVGLVLTGCTAQDDGAVEPAEESSPSEAPASPEDEALDAYDSMWEVVVEASHEGELDPPDLERYATGDALASCRGPSGAAKMTPPCKASQYCPRSRRVSSETVVLKTAVWLRMG